jgi:hypothetical protein
MMNIGCKLRSISVNIIAYADDIVLLAPTNSALQSLVEILNHEFNSLCLSLNYEKSVCMLFVNRRAINVQCLAKGIVVNGNELQFVKETNYLAFSIVDNLSDKADIVKCRNKFYSIFNVILRKYHYKQTNKQTKLYCVK